MPDEATKARRGCLFYGAVVAAVLLTAILVAALIGLRVAKRLYNQFTDTQPTPMPALRLSPAQAAAVDQRFQAFRDAVRAHHPAPPLTLSADDLNALLQTDPDFEPMKGKLYVTGIQDGLVTAQISVPMEEAGLPVFRGRYLNATATLGVSLRNGILRVVAHSVSARGRPLPEVYLQQVRKQNLVKNLNSNPRVSVALDRLQSIEARDGELMIVPKEE